MERSITYQALPANLSSGITADQSKFRTETFLYSIVQSNGAEGLLKTGVHVRFASSSAGDYNETFGYTAYLDFSIWEITSMTHTGLTDHSNDRTELTTYAGAYNNLREVHLTVNIHNPDGSVNTSKSYTQEFSYGVQCGAVVLNEMTYTASDPSNITNNRTEVYTYQRQTDGSLQKIKLDVLYGETLASNDYSEVYTWSNNGTKNSVFVNFGKMEQVNTSHTGGIGAVLDDVLISLTSLAEQAVLKPYVSTFEANNPNATQAQVLAELISIMLDPTSLGGSFTPVDPADILNQLVPILLPAGAGDIIDQLTGNFGVDSGSILSDILDQIRASGIISESALLLQIASHATDETGVLAVLVTQLANSETNNASIVPVLIQLVSQLSQSSGTSQVDVWTALINELIAKSSNNPGAGDQTAVNNALMSLAASLAGSGMSSSDTTAFLTQLINRMSTAYSGTGIDFSTVLSQLIGQLSGVQLTTTSDIIAVLNALVDEFVTLINDPSVTRSSVLSQLAIACGAVNVNTLIAQLETTQSEEDIITSLLNSLENASGTDLDHYMSQLIYLIMADSNNYWTYGQWNNIDIHYSNPWDVMAKLVPQLSAWLTTQINSLGTTTPVNLNVFIENFMIQLASFSGISLNSFVYNLAAHFYAESSTIISNYLAELASTSSENEYGVLNQVGNQLTADQVQYLVNQLGYMSGSINILDALLPILSANDPEGLIYTILNTPNGNTNVDLQELVLQLAQDTNISTQTVLYSLAEGIYTQLLGQTPDEAETSVLTAFLANSVGTSSSSAFVGGLTNLVWDFARDMNGGNWDWGIANRVWQDVISGVVKALGNDGVENASIVTQIISALNNYYYSEEFNYDMLNTFGDNVCDMIGNGTQASICGVFSSIVEQMAESYGIPAAQLYVQFAINTYSDYPEEHQLMSVLLADLIRGPTPDDMSSLTPRIQSFLDTIVSAIGNPSYDSQWIVNELGAYAQQIGVDSAAVSSILSSGDNAAQFYNLLNAMLSIPGSQDTMATILQGFVDNKMVIDLSYAGLYGRLSLVGLLSAFSAEYDIPYTPGSSDPNQNPDLALTVLNSYTQATWQTLPIFTQMIPILIQKVSAAGTEISADDVFARLKTLLTADLTPDTQTGLTFSFRQIISVGSHQASLLNILGQMTSSQSEQEALIPELISGLAFSSSDPLGTLVSLFNGIDPTKNAADLMLAELSIAPILNGADALTFISQYLLSAMAKTAYGDTSDPDQLLTEENNIILAEIFLATGVNEDIGTAITDYEAATNDYSPSEADLFMYYFQQWPLSGGGSNPLPAIVALANQIAPSGSDGCALLRRLCDRLEAAGAFGTSGTETSVLRDIMNMTSSNSINSFIGSYLNSGNEGAVFQNLVVNDFMTSLMGDLGYSAAYSTASIYQFSTLLSFVTGALAQYYGTDESALCAQFAAQFNLTGTDTTFAATISDYLQTAGRLDVTPIMPAFIALIAQAASTPSVTVTTDDVVSQLTGQLTEDINNNSTFGQIKQFTSDQVSSLASVAGNLVNPIDQMLNTMITVGGWPTAAELESMLGVGETDFLGQEIIQIVRVMGNAPDFTPVLPSVIDETNVLAAALAACDQLDATGRLAEKFLSALSILPVSFAGNGNVIPAFDVFMQNIARVANGLSGSDTVSSDQVDGVIEAVISEIPHYEINAIFVSAGGTYSGSYDPSDVLDKYRTLTSKSQLALFQDFFGPLMNVVYAGDTMQTLVVLSEALQPGSPYSTTRDFMQALAAFEDAGTDIGSLGFLGLAMLSGIDGLMTDLLPYTTFSTLNDIKAAFMNSLETKITDMAASGQAGADTVIGDLIQPFMDDDNSSLLGLFQSLSASSGISMFKLLAQSLRNVVTIENNPALTDADVLTSMYNQLWYVHNTLYYDGYGEALNEVMAQAAADSGGTVTTDDALHQLASQVVSYPFWNGTTVVNDLVRELELLNVPLATIFNSINTTLGNTVDTSEDAALTLLLNKLGGASVSDYIHAVWNESNNSGRLLTVNPDGSWTVSSQDGTQSAHFSAAEVSASDSAFVYHVVTAFKALGLENSLYESLLYQVEFDDHFHPTGARILTVLGVDQDTALNNLSYLFASCSGERDVLEHWLSDKNITGVTLPSGPSGLMDSLIGSLNAAYSIDLPTKVLAFSKELVARMADDWEHGYVHDTVIHYLISSGAGKGALLEGVISQMVEGGLSLAAAMTDLFNSLRSDIENAYGWSSTYTVDSFMTEMVVALAGSAATGIDTSQEANVFDLLAKMIEENPGYTQERIFTDYLNKDGNR